MVIVRFNQWEEFLEELGAKPPANRIVRVTFSRRYDGDGVPHLTLAAGYLNGDGIIEFVQYLGPESPGPEDALAREIAKLAQERRHQLEALGFKVKPGRYHVPPTLGR